ncbi:unnamed protein product [Pieris brassicae]|uniref:Uncharacterized protein n=1 Tax=Pieris brassicae TaxID=7116 RepID=A0A9P0WX05_PIEBR|nr:unnamed protein product [Pieris brassicae]
MLALCCSSLRHRYLEVERRPSIIRGRIEGLSDRRTLRPGPTPRTHTRAQSHTESHKLQTSHQLSIAGLPQETGAARVGAASIMRRRALVIKSVELVSDNYCVSGIVPSYHGLISSLEGRGGGDDDTSPFPTNICPRRPCLLSLSPCSRPSRGSSRPSPLSTPPTPLHALCIRYYYQISKITSTLTPS